MQADLSLRSGPLTVSIAALRRAAHSRKPGYLEAVLEIGRRVENNRLELDPEQWAEIARRFRLEDPKPAGLGDLVATVAKPIAFAVDKLFGTNLRGCLSCQRRRARLNRIRLS